MDADYGAGEARRARQMCIRARSRVTATVLFRAGDRGPGCLLDFGIGVKVVTKNGRSRVSFLVWRSARRPQLALTHLAHACHLDKGTPRPISAAMVRRSLGAGAEPQLTFLKSDFQSENDKKSVTTNRKTNGTRKRRKRGN